MPIIVYKDIAYVTSRSEFLKEYEKQKKVKNHPMENLLESNFDFNLSFKTIIELYKKAKEKHKNDFNRRLYSFDYFDEDAQNIAMELLVFFSKTPKHT